MTELRMLPESKRFSRRASMYIMVLGTTLCVMVIGMGAIALARLERRDAAFGQDFIEARSYARSAIEIGLNLVLNTPNWRTTFAQGAWRSAQPLGRGTYSLNVIDAVDGNFANNQDDLLLATGTGAIGQVQYQLAVNVAPYGLKGMECLDSAIHSAGYLESSKTVTISAKMSSNDWIKIRAGSIVNGNAQAVGTIQVDGTLNGTATIAGAAQEMPAATAFDYYIANGTTIPFTNNIQYKTLTPTYNNIGGGTNAQGIYVMSCGNNKVTIRSSRINATLVLLDPKSDSEIIDAVHWETASPTLPALMVRGMIDLKWSGNLVEVDLNTNFNPPGAPYQGSTDSSNDDAYLAKMKGLIYMTGNLKVSNPVTIEGAVITGGNDNKIVEPLTVTHDANLINNPPPGFERANRPMLPVAGTWKQIVN